MAIEHDHADVLHVAHAVHADVKGEGLDRRGDV
jgi:hypothetical protein